MHNYFPADSDFRRLLVAFATSFDPDQDHKNGGPDLDPHRLKLRKLPEILFRNN